jgi:hypothetical protein
VWGGGGNSEDFLNATADGTHSNHFRSKVNDLMMSKVLKIWSHVSVPNVRNTYFVDSLNNFPYQGL